MYDISNKQSTPKISDFENFFYFTKSETNYPNLIVFLPLVKTQPKNYFSSKFQNRTPWRNDHNLIVPVLKEREILASSLFEADNIDIHVVYTTSSSSLHSTIGRRRLQKTDNYM